MATVLEAPATIHQKLAAARLPALPQVVLQVMQQCEDESAGLNEIAAIVGQDAAISAQVMRVAHSPYYNRGRSLESLNQCLAVLGAQTVRRIALNQAIFDLLGRFQGAARVDLVPFWCHALLSALIAQRIARELGYPRAEEAYLAGLLHDIGRLALLAAAPEDYAPLFDKDEETLLAEERSRFGLTHAEAGGWLSERWRLTPLFCDSLRYHHEAPMRVRDAHPLVQIVHLANHLSTQGLADIDAGDWGLDAGRLKALLAAAQDTFRSSADAFGIPLTEAERAIAQSTTDSEPATAALAQAAEARLLAGDACHQETRPDAESQALMAIVRAASLIFGSSRAAWLEYSEGALQGVSLDDGQDDRLQEMRIPLSAATSRIAQALARPVMLRAGEADLALPDRHLAHLLAAPALLCLGLTHAGERMGVLVLALEESVAAGLGARAALISSFAAEAARCLGEARARTQVLIETRSALEAAHHGRVREAIHEVANPLGVVHNYLAILRDRLTTEAGAAEIDLMREELRRVSAILEQLRQSEAPATVMPEAVDLNALIRQVVEFCRRGKPEMARIETHYRLEEALPPVCCDRNKLKQILINLIFNAVEAMPEGGRLTLSTAYWYSGRRQGQIELGVEDTGPGISDDVLQQLYSPVASRKGGTHAGVGLAIVGRLVAELGAVIQCHSTGAGTRFKLLLPVQREPMGTPT